MQVREEQGRLVLTSGMTLMPAIIGAAAVACTWGAVQRSDPRLWAAVLLMIAGALATWRSDRVVFDPATRMIETSRWAPWRREAWSLPFSALTGLRLDMTPHLSSGRWRLVLKTTGGAVPLVPFYEGPRAHWQEIAERICAVAGLQALAQNAATER